VRTAKVDPWPLWKHLIFFYNFYEDFWRFCEGFFWCIFLFKNAIFKKIRKKKVSLNIFLTTSRRDVVLRLTFFPQHPPARPPTPPRPLVVWCFFSRFKTTFVTFLTFLGYLGLAWASKMTGTRSSERVRAS
jgi:hypothetical protein